MTADSTATISHSGEAGGSGVNSPSGRRSLPSPWAQVVRGAISSPPSPGVAELNPVFSDRVTVVEPETAAAAGTQPEGPDDSNNCNAGDVKKSAWNKPSANGVVEWTTTPVMGAASWPALSESTRPGVKSSSASSECSSKPSTDGSVTVCQAPAVLQPPPKQARSNANSHSNPNHVRQRSMRRGGNAGGASAGYTRPLPPPPPPLPPPLPLFDMSYGNLVPAVLNSPVREPPFKGNNWSPRSVGGGGSPSHPVPDHSVNRNPTRRNNLGPRPRGDGGPYLNNGYDGRRDHHDRDWRSPRSHAARDVHVPHQMGPPPPPPVRGFIRQPHPSPAPFIPPQPLRPYGTPMGYEMAASYLYVPTLPLEPYKGAPLLPHAASASMFIPLMDPPLHVLILHQIEYYFSDANLVKDNFLRSQMDEEGWVPIALIAGFRRVQSLTNDIQMIMNSLRDSSIVEIQGDKVRKRTEWRRWIQSSNRSEADTDSQPPHEATEHSIEEASMLKLTLEDMSTTTNDSVDYVHKEMGASDSLKLANWELSYEDPCS